MKIYNLMIISLFIFFSNTALANLIQNGTFDNNITGWTGNYNAINGGSAGYPAIDTGSYYYSGSNATNQISQVYNLTTQNLLSLNSLGLNFEMSADLFGYLNQGDHSIFTASFYSETDALLGNVSLNSAINAPLIWENNFIAGDLPNFQNITGILPSSTHSILFSLESIRTAGISNDGYADNLNFSISPVPEPATYALMLGGLGLIGFMAHRRRKSL